MRHDHVVPASMSDLFDKILQARGLDDKTKRQAFLNPRYEDYHDPFLLPDMTKAVDRLVVAQAQQQRITIYGDYDIDGLTASTVLVDAFGSFGFQHVDVFIPNRFKEGYGLTVEAVEEIAASGAELIITVDCGSLSTKEIERANELGVDVIVTDHHNVQKVQPPAVAVINPKRLLQDYPEAYQNYILDENTHVGDDRLYPFLDLAGVGVAFKLVQALQTRLEGLPSGQEKWLLDLVALGTVCDVVTLQGENRMFVFWGLKVLAQTRRPGLRALMMVAGVNPQKLNARDLGFGIGPRMNAAGRLETARYALDTLLESEGVRALELAQRLDAMNQSRRSEQKHILDQAIERAVEYRNDPVLVVSGAGWNHGIIGIVAAKLLERYQKPTFVLEEIGHESKGSARSYGDFSAADAIRSADEIITKGGGHALAAGVTLPTERIDDFRKQVNQFYNDLSLDLDRQQANLLAQADVTAELADITEELIEYIAGLEPFGNGNQPPIIRSNNVLVMSVRRMGAEGQHIKLTVEGSQGLSLQLLAFSAPIHFFVEAGQRIDVWYQPGINEWQGRRTVEGRLLRLETVE